MFYGRGGGQQEVIPIVRFVFLVCVCYFDFNFFLFALKVFEFLSFHFLVFHE